MLILLKFIEKQHKDLLSQIDDRSEEGMKIKEMLNRNHDTYVFLFLRYSDDFEDYCYIRRDFLEWILKEEKMIDTEQMGYSHGEYTFDVFIDTRFDNQYIVQNLIELSNGKQEMSLTNSPYLEELENEFSTYNDNQS